MPEGVLVKTEMDGAVLDMPLLASPEPSKYLDLFLPCNKLGKHE